MNKNADFSNHKHTQCYRSKHWTEKIWRKKATKIWPQTFNSNWYNQLFSIWKPITNYISRVKTHIPPASSLLLLLPHLIVWSRPLKSHFGQQLGKNIRGGPHLQYSQRLLNNTTNQIQSRREFQIIEISPFFKWSPLLTGNQRKMMMVGWNQVHCLNFSLLFDSTTSF